MYRCENCGHVFSDFFTLSTEYGSHRACPWCGVDDMVVVDSCDDCGRYFEDGSLFCGRCLSCLRETIDYPEALSYLLAREYLREFLASLDGEIATRANKNGLIQAFLVHEDRDRDAGTTEFLDKLRDYILEDSLCANDFAEWKDGRT